MTPERLQRALASLLPKAGNVDFLTGDASNRTYFRVHENEKSYIAMLLAQAGANSLAEEITKVGRPITELPFIDVLRQLAQAGVRVPKLYGYEETEGVLLLDDFGDTMLLDAALKATPAKIEDLYSNALVELEKIASIGRQKDRSSIAFSRAFDRDLYNWEFLHFVEYALDRRLKKPLSASAREKIVSTLAQLTNEYLLWEQVFCHRDYHSRNLVILPSTEEIGIIDFQDALLAPLYYDLASLLRDSYISLDSALQGKLVEAYRLRMKPAGLKGTESKDAFRRAFDLMGMHRNLKAAGRFFYIDEVKKNPRYLADIPRTLSYVEATILRYDELRSLRELLIPHFPDLVQACQR